MIVYVAGPFRGKTAWDVEQNVQVAEAVTFEIAAHGHTPLCPHTMYRHFNGTLTDDFWLDATIRLLELCAAVVLVPGWRASNGTRAEIAHAQKHDIPVFYSLEDWKNEVLLHSLR